MLESGARRVDASLFVAIAGEVVLNERALRDGTRLTGVRPSAVLLVENLGPYMDVSAPEDWMIIHVPGWNTITAKQVLDQLEDIPILHFGDLDPQGAEIVSHLRKQYPRLRWVVPSFWSECVPHRAQKQPWPSDLDLTRRALAGARTEGCGTVARSRKQSPWTHDYRQHSNRRLADQVIRPKKPLKALEMRQRVMGSKPIGGGHYIWG